MKFLDTSKSRGWLVGICLVVILIVTALNKYDNVEITEDVFVNKTEINRINDLLKSSKLRQDTMFGSIMLLQKRKSQTIYNTLKIENDHEAKINAYNKLDTSGEIKFLAEWIFEQERLSKTD